jgi:hypothetical protein
MIETVAVWATSWETYLRRSKNYPAIAHKIACAPSTSS